jgi:hypothetical protein
VKQGRARHEGEDPARTCKRRGTHGRCRARRVGWWLAHSYGIGGMGRKLGQRKEPEGDLNS